MTALPVTFESRYIEEMRAQHYQDDIASMEGLLDFLKKLIPDSIKSFLGFSKSLQAMKVYALPLDSNDIKFLQKNLIPLNYMDLENQSLVCPPYYTGTYLQYCHFLRRAAEYSQHITTHIDNYDRQIGLIISAHDGFIKDQSSTLKDYQTWRVQREDLKKELASLYTGKSTSHKAPYYQLIKRQADWETIITDIVDIAKLINQIDPKFIKSKIETLSIHLAEIKRMIEGNLVKETSKDFGKQIAVGTLEIAEQVEFYALLRYQYDIMTNIIHESVKLLK